MLPKTAWYSAKYYPTMENLTNFLVREKGMTMLSSHQEFEEWAQKNPGSFIVLRGHNQYLEKSHEILERYSLSSVNSLKFLRTVSNRQTLFDALKNTDVPVPDECPCSEGWISKPLSPAVHKMKLSSVKPDDKTMFTQKYIPNSGQDTKVYVAYKHLYALIRPSNLNRKVDKLGKSQPVKITKEILDAARVIREELDGEMFGMDFVRGEDGINYIVDINAFPSMSIVPGIEQVFMGFFLNKFRILSTRL